MNQAFNCEALFNRGEVLAAGVAALGDMLQWAPDEVQQGTLVALGGILCRMGEDIIALRKEFLDKSFHDILKMETAAKTTAAAQSEKSALIDLASPKGKARVQALAEAFCANEAEKSIIFATEKRIEQEGPIDDGSFDNVVKLKALLDGAMRHDAAR